ncbi:hypothetical protein ABIB07_006535 [Bradyrhizobium sp. RT10b]
MIKIIAVLCNLSSPANCHEQTVTTSDFADVSMQSCLMGRAATRRVDEAASGRTPGGLALRDRQIFRSDRLPRALQIDEVDQCCLVMILKLLGGERARLLVNDMPCEVEHVLGDFDVLDLVEVLLLGSDLVGIAQQRTDETFLQRFERDNVLAAALRQGRRDSEGRCHPPLSSGGALEDADADRRQEAGKGSGRKEAGGRSTAEVGLGTDRS